MESKKLAELLGIPPKIDRQVICVLKYTFEDYEIHPDFEEPENFVKLLDYMTELDYGLQLEKSSITIEGCYCNWDIKKSKTENYISGITEFLENEKSESIDFDVNSAPYWHNIQQQAQKVEWKY
jgi:hypothetical protein